MDLGIHYFILFLSIVLFWCWCWLRQGLVVRSIWRRRRIISFVMVMVVLKVGIIKGICLVGRLGFWGRDTLRRAILKVLLNQAINRIHNTQSIQSTHQPHPPTLTLPLPQPTNSTTHNAQASWSTFPSLEANKPTTITSSEY